MEKDTTRGLGWSGRLGMVDTIFEEEEYIQDLHSSISSPALSPPYSSPSSPDLPSSVEAWSQVTGRRPDVKIYVQGECFWLHKEVVTCKSGYLKRKLQEVSELSLSPPLKVTLQAFKLFAEFSYQCDVVLTPFNIAPLRTAVELLNLARDDDDNNKNNLRHKAESYFSSVVAVKAELSAAVFLSSLGLLPEAEDLAKLPSRCLEAMYTMDGVLGCVECVKAVKPAEFRVIVDSMRRRLDRGHDMLYRIVDLYVKVYEGKMSEEQKTGICNSIDCNMLSPQLLMHAVQNPRMPLRFTVQAMLIEQLNARHSISCADLTRPLNFPLNQEDDTAKFSAEATTLGALLQRDAALRQVTQLKEAMDTTTSHIQSLEKELSDMKARLIESEKKGNSVNDRDLCGRSVSCRFISKGCNKVEKGERRSVSSSNLGYNALPSGDNGEQQVWGRAFQNENVTSRSKKNIGHWLMRGLKSAFRVSSSGTKKDLSKDVGNVPVVEDHSEIYVAGTHSFPSPHQRRHSLS